MSKPYGGKGTLGALIRLVKGDLATKQDHISGQPGELLMIGEDGKVTTTSALADLLEALKEI